MYSNTSFQIIWNSFLIKYNPRLEGNLCWFAVKWVNIGFNIAVGGKYYKYCTAAAFSFFGKISNKYNFQLANRILIITPTPIGISEIKRHDVDLTKALPQWS